MKTANLYKLTLLLVWAFFLHACTAMDNDIPVDPQEVIVDLHISPLLENDSKPLTKAGLQESGIYAVNISWRRNTAESYRPYATGLFSDISRISIGLIEGYLYRFDCSFLMQSELYPNEEGLYGLPFSTTTDKRIDAAVTNKLTVSINPLNENTTFHQHIYKGAIHLGSGETNEWPLNTHRFYGSYTLDLTQAPPVTEDNQPTATVSIELKRAYYTLRFGAEKLSAGDSIKIEASSTPTFLIEGTGNEYTYSEERIYSMKEIASYGTGNIYSNEKIPVTIYYRPKQATEWTRIINNQPITLERNCKNLITIKNIDQHYQGDATISFEGDKDNLNPSNELDQTIG